MTLIILGLILWIVPHYWKRLAPDHRAGFGDKGKLIVTVTSFVSIALMVIGYRGAEFIAVWNPLLRCAGPPMMFAAGTRQSSNMTSQT